MGSATAAARFDFPCPNRNRNGTHVYGQDARRGDLCHHAGRPAHDDEGQLLKDGGHATHPPVRNRPV